MLTRIKGTIPKVTIGLPVYNGAQYISNALDSLLAQTFSDFELIISDNFSTDGTEGLCREYAKKDPRIIYIRQNQNLGPVLNFKFVLDHARSQYFMWAACDDLWGKECIASYIQVLEDNKNLGVVVGKYWITSIFMPFLAMQKTPTLYFINHPSPLVRLKAFLDLPGNSHKANLIYGLWRVDAIKGFFNKSSEFAAGVYQGLDITMLARILVSVRGYQIDQTLFYKRYPYIPQGHLFSYVNKGLFQRLWSRCVGALINKKPTSPYPTIYSYCSLLRAMMHDVLDVPALKAIIDNHCKKSLTSSRINNIVSSMRYAFKFGVFIKF